MVEVAAGGAGRRRSPSGWAGLPRCHTWRGDGRLPLFFSTIWWVIRGRGKAGAVPNPVRHGPRPLQTRPSCRMAAPARGHICNGGPEHERPRHFFCNLVDNKRLHLLPSARRTVSPPVTHKPSRPAIGGARGAARPEESRRHQLHCRFTRTDNRLRFAKGRAIAWNVRALNRFEWANRLKVPIPSYGGQQAHAECARRSLPAVGRAAWPSPEMVAWPMRAREGRPGETDENYAPTSPVPVSLNIIGNAT